MEVSGAFRDMLSTHTSLYSGHSSQFTATQSFVERGRSKIIDWLRSNLSSTYGFEPGRRFFFSVTSRTLAFSTYRTFSPLFADRDYREDPYHRNLFVFASVTAY